MKGQCLCGAVTFTAPDTRELSACHCDTCRRWGGGPLLTVHCGPDVVFSGREHISVYASSDWAERAFCRGCGSHLYYRLLATGEHFVPAGACDTGDFALTSQIYIEQKPPYYDFANDTPRLTGAQVMALFAQDGGAPVG